MEQISCHNPQSGPVWHLGPLVLSLQNHDKVVSILFKSSCFKNLVKGWASSCAPPLAHLPMDSLVIILSVWAWDVFYLLPSFFTLKALPWAQLLIIFFRTAVRDCSLLSLWIPCFTTQTIPPYGQCSLSKFQICYITISMKFSAQCRMEWLWKILTFELPFKASVVWSSPTM